MKGTRAALTVALVFGLLAAPLAPEAQQAGRRYRIGLLDYLKTAKALGLTIPQSVLARADQVIE